MLLMILQLFESVNLPSKFLGEVTFENVHYVLHSKVLFASFTGRVQLSLGSMKTRKLSRFEILLRFLKVSSSSRKRGFKSTHR